MASQQQTRAGNTAHEATAHDASASGESASKGAAAIQGALRQMDGYDKQVAALTPGSGNDQSIGYDMSLIEFNNDTGTPNVITAEKPYGYAQPKVAAGVRSASLENDLWKMAASVSISVTKAVWPPTDKIDVTSASDPKITKENAQQAVNDLTPNNLGLVARTKFVASHLSSAHEDVHVKDYQKWTAEVVEKRKSDIAGFKKAPKDQDAAKTQLQGMLMAVQGDLIERYAGPGKRQFMDCVTVADGAEYAQRPGEKNAFGTVRPMYQALADGIAKRFNVKVDPLYAAHDVLENVDVPASREALVKLVTADARNLVALLAKGDPTTVNTLKARCEPYRPLPDEVVTILKEAWEKATNTKPLVGPVLAALVGLRFGIDVNANAPADYCVEVWDALGRLPTHHVESTDAKKNQRGYNNFDASKPRDGDEDPLKSIRLVPNADSGVATAGGGNISVEFSQNQADRNRFRKDREALDKDGKVQIDPVTKKAKPNSGTLPDNLGPDVTAEEGEKLRDDFANAGIKNLSHSVLHEVGHALDRSRGIMDGSGYNFPKWEIHSANAAKAITDDLGLPATDSAYRFGTAADFRGRLEKELASKGPGALINNSGPLWDGNGKLLEQAKASKAGQWLQQQGSGGAAAFQLTPVDIGGRTYVWSPGDDSKGKWTSYNLGYRTAHSVSDYQWKTHREYFAECYAVYYDSKTPGELLARRDPQMKAKLDELHKDSKVAQK